MRKHRELALLVLAGLSPMDALTLATRNAAELMNLSDRGTIAPGKRADLVVLARDPSNDTAVMDRIMETWAAGRGAPGVDWPDRSAAAR